MTKFITSTGYLTDYALSCGYIEHSKDDVFAVRLEKCHGVYEVSTKDGGVLSYFTSLTLARACFKESLKDRNLKREVHNEH